MSMFLEDLKNTTMYKKPFIIPVNDDNRRKGSSVFLMTQNNAASVKLMNSPLIINKNLFEAYYVEKNINFIINQENKLISFDNPQVGSLNEVVSEEYAVKYTEDAIMKEDYVQTKDMITYFDFYNEDAIYNTQLKNILYDERIKNNKEIFSIYSQVKKDCPKIKDTFIDYRMYKKKNIFIDWSYYTESFFKNNYFTKDKGLNLFLDFMNRFLFDPRLEKNGYTKKTVFVYIKDWIVQPGSSLWDYNKNINPISIIYRNIKSSPDKLKSLWGGLDFVFIGDTSYFKVDFNELSKENVQRFILCLDKAIKNDPVADTLDIKSGDSKKAIVSDIIDKIEVSQGITINNLTGTKTVTPKEVDAKIKNAVSKASDEEPIEKEDKKKELVDIINKAAETAKDADEAIENLENDEFIKKILQDLSEDEDSKVKMNATRTNRMIQMNTDLQSKKFKNITIKDILNSEPDVVILPTALPIDSIDDSWKNMKFMNFDKQYDLDSDIVKCIHSFSDPKKETPIGIIEIGLEDTSTAEDFKETYTVQCEDIFGQRFKLIFDIPRLKDNRFMRIGGNEKIISGQLMLLPIIKTDTDTCQMVSNYNKIFIKRFGVTNGKSYIIADRIMKSLNKMKSSKDFNIISGDNSKICERFELPIDYVDLSSELSKVEVNMKNGKDSYVIYFNQDEIRDLYKVDDSKGLAAVVMNPDKENNILYWNTSISDTFSNFLYSILSVNNEEFNTYYDATTTASRYTYSKASILNTDIPLIVICGYNEGLTTTLRKANVLYELLEKRPQFNKNMYDVIKFSDGYLKYDLNYNSSLLMNGLKECNTEEFSLKEINSKSMWVSFLDIFGGRINADGLDNFYDLMMDPITVEICKKYDLPSDYVEALLYSNTLLADNKYNRHVDITGNRYRSNEVIAGYTYKALSLSYGSYRNVNKRGRKTPMTMKKTAVIDYLMQDPTESDVSTNQPLLEIESRNAVSFKGLSGMNSDRSYSLDKRTFDDTMINNIAMSTGFAGNVGVTRQMTIDSNIQDTRGSIKITSDLDKMGTTKSLCMTEALTPFGVTRDDPFRTAMTFVQTAKHSMRVLEGDPLLVTNGADSAMAYMTSDTFAFKAKGKGKIKEITETHMIVEYDKPIDVFGKMSEVIDLRELVKKNSDGGFFVTVKLSTDLAVGKIVKERDILAYDKLAYNSQVGPEDDIAYNLGTIAKIAIMNTDEGYEDSAIISEKLARKMSSDIVIQKSVMLPKNTNIYNMLKKGAHVQEGDSLMIFQNAFSDEDINTLLRNITDDGDELVSDLGRIPIKSKITGEIQDIKIYRTVEKDELSPSLKKIVDSYETDINKMRKVMNEYDKDAVYDLDANYKLPTTGKLKKAGEMVLVEFYLKYRDKMSVGDKIVYYSALKGVVKDIFPEGEEPTSEFRPNEQVDALLSVGSINARMVGSILNVGSLNKVLIELARKSRDIMGIPYDENL